MYVAMFAQSIPGLDVSMNLMLPQNTVICASGGGDESVELQKILAADALVPKTLMAAMNVFALVAVKCDCYEGCRQRLEMEKRLGCGRESIYVDDKHCTWMGSVLGVS